MGFVQPVDKGAYYNFDVKISSEACLNMASCYQTIGHELRHTSSANWDLPSPIGSSYQYAPNYGQSPGGNYENDAEYYGKWLAKKYGY